MRALRRLVLIGFLICAPSLGFAQDTPQPLLQGGCVELPPGDVWSCSPQTWVRPLPQAPRLRFDPYLTHLPIEIGRSGMPWRLFGRQDREPLSPRDRRQRVAPYQRRDNLQLPRRRYIVPRDLEHLPR